MLYILLQFLIRLLVNDILRLKNKDWDLFIHKFTQSTNKTVQTLRLDGAWHQIIVRTMVRVISASYKTQVLLLVLAVGVFGASSELDLRMMARGSLVYTSDDGSRLCCLHFG